MTMPDAVSSYSLLSDVSIVIRTVGERTESACRAAILAQGVSPDQVITVRESPFSKAMKTGFEGGIAAGRPWTFCIDADVILRPGSIEAMMRQAVKQPPSVFEVQGLVLDKLFVSLREAGNHLFRTSLLDQMIECIPAEGTSLRPESSAISNMAERGFAWARIPYVVGLHDFEQYNRDIFRKCFTHAQKHGHLLADVLVKMTRRAPEDPDFAIALDGIMEGLRSQTAVRIDVKQAQFGERFEALGLAEKSVSPPDRIEPEVVEAILRDWAGASDLTVRGVPVAGPEAVELDGTEQLSGSGRWKALLRRKGEELGLAGLGLFTLGGALEASGARLKRLAGGKS